MKTALAIGALAALAACQKAPSADNVAVATSETVNVAAATPASSDVAPPAFAQCKVCHAVAAGAPHGVGPNLHGVYGTKAGDIPGYSFSAAMKASGLTWDDATLDKYLANPRAVVPGTKMSFAGLSDAAKRAQVITYLKTLN